MTWLVWRQHRKQLLFGVAALFALGAIFLVTGMPMHDRFEKLGLPDACPQPWTRRSSWTPTRSTARASRIAGGRRGRHWRSVAASSRHATSSASTRTSSSSDCCC